MITRALLAALAGALCVGCGSPTHMQYDFGRATTEAFGLQADLTRPAASGKDYPLDGLEASAIRLRVQESATDVETGESELEAGALQ